MTRAKGIRFAGFAVVVAALIAGAFLIGRSSESGGGETTVTTTVAGPLGYVPEDATVTYDINDVVDVLPPTIVRDGEILEQPKGSPERALLEWWQAYQFSDLRAVEELTAEATIDGVGEDNLTALVELPGPGLNGIEIVEASESGDTATVEAALLNFTPKAPGKPVPDKPTASVPETLTMQNDGGEWLFADTEFLTLKLNSLPE